MLCMDETEESRRGSSSSSDSESDEIQETDATNPISTATNAGARLSETKSASISRKRQIHTNQGKYKGRGNKIRDRSLFTPGVGAEEKMVGLTENSKT